MSSKNELKLRHLIDNNIKELFRMGLNRQQIYELFKPILSLYGREYFCERLKVIYEEMAKRGYIPYEEEEDVKEYKEYYFKEVV